MSGEAVVVTAAATSPVGLAVIAGAAALVIAGSIAAEAMEAAKEKRKIEAMHRHQEELSRNNKLRNFEHLAMQQQQEQQNYEQILLRLSSYHADEATDGNVEADFAGDGEGFLEDHQQQDGLLREMAQIMDELPPALLQMAQSPFPRLRQRLQDMQQQNAQGKPLVSETLENFRLTLENTVRLQAQQQEQKERTRLALLERAQALLDTAIQYKYQAITSAQHDELFALQAHLQQILQDGELRAATLQVLEQRAKVLSNAIEEQHIIQSAKDVLQQRMQVHLADMGYQWLQADESGRDLWHIPGGERIAVAVQDDLRIGFQLQHERSSDMAESEIGDQEASFMRRQEHRWCGDLKQLIRQLVADGFQYSLQFEREIPQESVPIVVVDDAASWEREATERSDSPKARHLS